MSDLKVSELYKQATGKECETNNIQLMTCYTSDYIGWLEEQVRQANGENKEYDKALHLRGVVFSETDNMCKTCNKPIRMYDGILQQLCECERVAEVCKCLQCYPIVTADGNLAKKCINCGIEHLQT